MHITDNFYES